MILVKKQKLLLSFILSQLFIIFLVCINSTIASYHTTFPKDDKKLPLQGTRDILSVFLSLPIVSEYTAAVGIDAGYGFFAPNVASAYVLKFEVLNKSGKVIKTFYTPPFKSREGLIKYDTFLGAFQDRMIALEEKSRKKDKYKNTKYQDLHIRFLDALIKSMSRNLLTIIEDENANRMVTTLYLYDFPPLDKFLLGTTMPHFVHLLNFKVKKTAYIK